MWQAYPLAQFILETNYPSRRIIRETDNPSRYKSGDGSWQIIRLDINSSSQSLGQQNQLKVLEEDTIMYSSVVTTNMAEFVEFYMNKVRKRELGVAAYQRKVSVVTRMVKPKTDFMNVILASSLATPTKDRKLRNRDEIRSKNWWEDGDARWWDHQFKKRRS